MSGKLVSFRGASANVKVLYLSTVVIVVLSAGLLLNWTIHTRTFVKATTHQPETYTELYFTHPNSLPASINAGQAVPVAFTIHNVEARTMLYTYDITITLPNGSQQTLTKEQISLANSQAQSVADSISLPTVAGRYEINVQLEKLPESIHYWTELVS